MSLVFAPVYAKKSDYSGFNITDETGEESIGNPNGWGPSNLELTNLVDCTLEITKPDPITLMPSTDPAMKITIDVFFDTVGVLPNITGAIQEILADDDLGYTDGKLPSGIYYMNMYGHDDAATLFSNTQYVMSLGAVKCCIRKLYPKINLKSCGCSETTADQDRADVGISYIWGAEAAFALGLNSDAANFILRANETCLNCGC